MNFKTTVLINLLIFNSIIICAQISHGGKPYSFGNREALSDSVPVVRMPFVDADSLLTLDENEKNTGFPYQFGHAFDVDLSMDNSGVWDTLSDGNKVWRLKILSENAFSINLIFDFFRIPSGATLFIYNSNKNILLGAFTSNNNKPHNKFSTDIIKSNTIILEYFEPVNKENGIININKVIHGYKDILLESGHDNLTLDCYYDMACSQGQDWCIEKRSVALILVDDNTRLCSGSLINNTSENLTPYFLTANHCLTGNPSEWIFRFQYWSPTCNKNDDAETSLSISGSNLRANYFETDFALLELSSLPPDEYGVVYAGWDRTSSPAQTSSIIHHPGGSTMKITSSSLPAEPTHWFIGPPGTHWKITLEEGDGSTEGGSSGAPLFNENHRIVGQNTGQDTDVASHCPPVEKKYGRFDISWEGGGASNNRLKDWLDPDNTGLKSINSISSSGNIGMDLIANCNASANIAFNKLYSNCDISQSSVQYTEYIAGDRIELESGFNSGSSFEARIKTNICNDNMIKNIKLNNSYSIKSEDYVFSSNDKGSEHTIPTNIIDVKQLKQSLTIHPNPTEGTFQVNIQATEGVQQTAIYVYDQLGRQVYSKVNASLREDIDLSGQGSGVYIVRVESDREVFIEKLVVR